MKTFDVDRVCQVLAEIAPPTLGESWDNIGLLVGNRRSPVRRVMTCLTITPPVAEEAVARQVDLVVAHHPLPFKPLSRLTTDSTAGSILIRLIAGGVAVYSAHTAFDSARSGINQMWAEGLGLNQIKPLVAIDATSRDTNDSQISPELGGGRYGVLPIPMPIDALASQAGRFCRTPEVRVVAAAQEIRKVAIACGSGGGFLSAAKAKGCQALITGETTFHNCLEAESVGISLVLVGHYASERFAMETMANDLNARIDRLGGDCEVFASDAETDPLRTVVIDPPKH